MKFNFAFRSLICIFAFDMAPLAERMRPLTLDDYVGQRHLVGPGAVLRRMIEGGRLSSFILWGPPGVGKTTLATIIAHQLQTPFYTLSAVTSGVKEVREVIDKAKGNRFFNTATPILFIDEIHRFSKSQQDSLLGAVEQGVVTLIGATTENTLSDYYTTFSPGGMRVDGNTTAIKFLEYKSKFAKVENNKLILKEPNIKYVVISERNSTNDYGYLAVKNYGKLIASVKSKGNNLDVFEMRPIGSWNISELDTIRNNINDIKLVLSEDVIGPSFDIYDVSSK